MLLDVKAGKKVLPDQYTYLFVPGFMWKRYPGEMTETTQLSHIDFLSPHCGLAPCKVALLAPDGLPGADCRVLLGEPGALQAQGTRRFPGQGRLSTPSLEMPVLRSNKTGTCNRQEAPWITRG
jgi:hypothetical protein